MVGFGFGCGSRQGIKEQNTMTTNTSGLIAWFGSLQIHAEVSKKLISCRSKYSLSMNCNSGSVRKFCVSLFAF